MRLGAFDAIRLPVQPTDAELIVLRAMREDRETMTPQRMIARADLIPAESSFPHP
jgi:hypothetical protein